MTLDELSLGVRMLPDRVIDRRRAFAAALATDTAAPPFLRQAAALAGEVLDVLAYGIDPATAISRSRT
ncbi:hypothetical protein NBH00_12755 [Paraconexibacter antarcticus]|uniref:Uncharacterized protein n=1 Tax=Paraconexibacter antarcticus TaxID=2949664 RepID=A0ABY5DKJ6_9ACTN|nr:hypothetical protein [Paraconexibacter antarcticus]UTI62238.1 hypothetical protein NBH00_12755 [Paraconexibacter antarcticus]